MLWSRATGAALFALLAGGALVTAACDRSDKDGNDEKASAQQPESTAEAKPGTDDDHHEEEQAKEEDHHDHGHGGVHLGAKMHELGRRFAAVWFAGEAGNTRMVDYQLHEMEEVISEIKEADPTEHGINVADQLDARILGQLETLETSVGSDKAKFKKTYRSVMKQCTSCHADTEHGFINVKIPEYNPYPNLEMKPQK
jgi:cytochrome c553